MLYLVLTRLSAQSPALAYHTVARKCVITSTYAPQLPPVNHNVFVYLLSFMREILTHSKVRGVHQSEARDARFRYWVT